MKWGLCGQVSGGNSGSSSAKSNQQAGPPSGSQSGGSVNFAGFVAKLDEMEKNSTDHEQVKLVGMLSAIFGQLKE